MKSTATIRNEIVHIGPFNLELPAVRGGAIERRMVELAAAQARRGSRVIVYSVGARDEDVEYAGFVIRRRRGPSGRLGRLVLSRRCAQEIAGMSPRVVHLHSRAEIGWILRGTAPHTPTVLSCDYHLAPLARVPVARTVSRSAWSRCMQAVSLVAPVSEYCAGQYLAAWPLDPARVAIIPNGVDAERFRPDPAAREAWRRRLGLENFVVLLYVGRLCEQKGTDLLVAAWREIRKRHPRARLVAVGPAGQFGNTGSNAVMDALVAEEGIHVPPVSDADLPGVYNMADIFVMPTRELEMFGMAAVEAQACGKPVVASNNGGLVETVTPEAGLHFQAGDVAGLIAALEGLLLSPAMARRLEEAARRQAMRFAWPAVASRCEEVYDQATFVVGRAA